MTNIQNIFMCDDNDLFWALKFIQICENSQLKKELCRFKEWGVSHYLNWTMGLISAPLAGQCSSYFYRQTFHTFCDCRIINVLMSSVLFKIIRSLRQNNIGFNYEKNRIGFMNMADGMIKNSRVVHFTLLLLM